MSDVQVRKYWLVTLVLSAVYNLASTFYRMSVDYGVALVPRGFQIWLMLFSGFAMIGMQYLTYHCAYKRRGTKLLTFLIAIGLLGWVVGGVSWVKGGAGMPQDAWGWMEIAWVGGLSVAWLYLCWKMREINKRVRVRGASS